MNTYVVGSAVAALLLTLAGTPSPAPAALSRTAQARTLEVHREYGQGPVTIPAGVPRVLLTFHGRHGDKVLLEPSTSSLDTCHKVSLRGRSGTVAPWHDKFWRLPARGRYTFDYRRCFADNEESVQLVKVNLHPLYVDGPRGVPSSPTGGSVLLGYQKGGAYVDAGTVAVPRRGRVQVRPTSTEPGQPWSALYLKGAPRLDIALWHQEAERVPVAVYLEAGAPVANEQGEMMEQDRALVPNAGQRVILMPGDKRVRVRVTRARSVPGTLDGAAVPVAADRRYQEVGVRFRSEGDQWVTATVKGQLASRSLPSLALLAPDGRTLVGLKHATTGGSGEVPDLWYLPAPGRYRLMVRTDPAHDSGRIKFSSVRELEAEMPADGEPLAFTAQEPGEWVLATGQLADVPYKLTAEATGEAEWRALANALPFVVCRSSFCDFGTSAFLSPDVTSHYPLLQSEGQWIFVVAFGAGQTGTVSLRLTPTT